MKKLNIFLLSLFIILLPTSAVLAQEFSCDIEGSDWLEAAGIENGLLIPCQCLSSESKGDVNVCGLDQIYQTIINFSQLILALTGAAALLMFIYGGVLWIIAAGNQDQIQKGKAAIQAAAIGIAIILSAWLIVNFAIYALVGGDIENVQLFGGNTVWSTFWSNAVSN